MTSEQRQDKRVLLTGVSGYIGGRLLPRLLDEGYAVRSLVRHPERAEQKEGSKYSIIQGDLLEKPSLEGLFDNIEVAFYLVHSLGADKDFEEKEYACARNFVAAARNQGVQRIVYLGGLGHGDSLSPHLKTRQEVGKILRDSGIETIEFRASIIIGSGSLSFEMVRALVGRLPIMITPRWVRSKAQPIGVEDVLAYLLEAISIPIHESIVVEIGGPEIVSYMDIMTSYAELRGVSRYMVPVPWLSPNLSSLWLSLVTPLYARVGRKLITSIQYDTLVEDDSASLFSITPVGLSTALQRAMVNEDRAFAETRWSNAFSTGRGFGSYGGKRFGSRLVDSRSVHVRCTLEEAFRPIIRIGGKEGWYYAQWAWWIRGLIDQLLGGVGVRRGRNRPDTVKPGEHLDFWRVEAVEKDSLLRLRAEMKVPGRAWLQFEVSPDSEGAVNIHQTAIFDPLGVSGLLYWYALYPIHVLIFQGMLNEIAKRATGESNP